MTGLSSAVPPFATLLWSLLLLFVQEAVDCGAVLLQEAVSVLHGDTEHSLSERVKLVEHRIFPRALELLTSSTVTLDDCGKVVWH